MSWNHRVFSYTDTDSGETTYTIRETYYDNSDKIEGWTADRKGIAPIGETVEELREEILRMYRATFLDVLEDTE